MITVEENLEPDKNWNNRLLQAGIGPMVQTTQMSTSYKIEGGTPKFLTFNDANGNILGQLMLGVMPRFTNSSSHKILKKLPGIKKSTYYWVQGPIIFQDSFSVKPEHTLESIKRAGQKLEAEVLLKAVRMHLADKLEVRWRKVHTK